MSIATTAAASTAHAMIIFVKDLMLRLIKQLRNRKNGERRPFARQRRMIAMPLLTTPSPRVGAIYQLGRIIRRARTQETCDYAWTI